MQKRCFLALMALGLLTAGSAYAGDGEVLGTLLGAGAGGIIGNQFGHGSGRVAATTAGIVFGGLAGNSIGASYDRDRQYASAGNSYYSGDYPAPVIYQNAYVPNYVAPPAPPPEDPAYYDEAANAYCREFTQQVRVGDQIQESYGTACLQPDGSWRIMQ